MGNLVTPMRFWPHPGPDQSQPPIGTFRDGLGEAVARPTSSKPRPDAWAVLACVLLSYIASIGKAGPLALLPLLTTGALLLAAYPGRYFNAICRNKIVFCLPLLALASTLWSRHPDISLKLSIEMLLTTTIGVVLASTVTPRAFLSAFLCATFAIDAVGFAFGTREFIYTTNEFANNGFFGSKNNFGMFCAILTITSLSMLVDKARNLLGTLVGISGFVVGLALMIQAKSLGAIMTCTLAAGVVVGGALMRPLRHSSRPPIVIGVVLSMIFALGMVFVAVGGLDPFLALVGKSSNLTGRTILWEQARRLWDLRPSLGLGYQAFWVQGTAEAENLWRLMRVSARAGFHFHNTFYAVAVELGTIGLAVLIITILAVGRNAFRAALIAPTGPQLCFASLFTLVLLRLPTEVDMLLPFAHGTLLLPIIYCFSNRAIAEAHAGRRRS